MNRLHGFGGAPALCAALAATACGSSVAGGPGDGGAGAVEGSGDAGGQTVVGGGGDDAAVSVGVVVDASEGQDSSGAVPDDAGQAIDAAGVGSEGGPHATGDGSSGTGARALVFSPYKDTGINMNWNTNVISTAVSGTTTDLGSDLVAHGGKAVTLAFATGECASENWAGVAGDTMASANVPLLSKAGADYVVSTGGAAGIFTCTTDSGFATFIGRWMSSSLIGIDFDIEAGQSVGEVGDLVQRVKTAHGAYSGLRFSFTLGTLANNSGAGTAQSLGSSVQDSFNMYGDLVIAAVKSTLGFAGTASTWPSYVTIDLMTMDYGSASENNCVVSGGVCEMGQSAIQAAYNLHDRWGVPYSNIELTPMIGGNDVSDEKFGLADVDLVSAFAISQGLAGVHYWSFDRDTDCATGAASSTCNSMGSGYAGAYGYLKRFLGDSLQ